MLNHLVIGNFQKWILDGVEVNENPITLTMDSDHNLVAIFEPIDFGEPELKSDLHVYWDPDLTDQNPWICTKEGEVASPIFHFIVGYKYQGQPIFFTIDHVMIEELTDAHESQPIILTCLSVSGGFPDGCTMRPIGERYGYMIQILIGFKFGELCF